MGESGSPAGEGPLGGAPARCSLGSFADLREGAGVGKRTGERGDGAASRLPAGSAGLQSLRGATAAPLLTPPLHMSDRTSVWLALSDAFTAYARASVSFSVDGGTDPADTDLLSLLAFSGSKS